ncbi:glycosyltransferase family 4 protein [Candidatus Pseudothioglobus sp. Uisw_050_01]|uniref:glycosyltransferase family 4 protein n=1 Tax=Candidatus Pseudothioglobus sp. Uisw_050_01 TaxID=3230997 RepID=UPI003A8C7410
MKKILIIGGYPKSLIQFRGKLLESFIKKGYVVTACSDGIDQEITMKLHEMGIEYIPANIKRTSINPLNDIFLLFQLILIIRKIKPDAILTYTIKPVIFGMIAARLSGISNRYAMITGLGYVFTSVDSIGKKLLRLAVSFLYRLSLSSAKVVFFQNNDDLNLFRSKGVVTQNANCIRVMGSGVDLDYYSFTESFPKELNFIMVARLLNDKGIKEYVQAARNVKKLNRYKKINFYLLGGFDSSPASIQPDDLKKWELDGSIKYLGEVEDVRPYIKDCSVFVLPSYREGMPRSVLEAMSMGRAIITTDVPGCRDTVVNNINGYLVKARSAEDLSRAMISMLDNPQVILEMGIASRGIAEAQFNVDKVNELIIDKFEQVTKKKEKLLLVTSSCIFFSDILSGQPKYLNNHYEVSLAAGDSLGSEKIIKNEDLNVHKISMNRGISPILDIFSLLSAILLILKLRPKIVQSFTPKAGFIFMIASWICRTPIRIHTFTGLIFPTSSGFKKKIIMSTDKLLCFCAKYIVAEGLGVKNDLITYKITNKEIEIIGDGNVAGVDTSYYAPSSLNLTDIDLPIHKESFVLCFVGRLAIDKGIKELIEAFKDLPKNMALVLVGNLDEREPIKVDLLDLLQLDDRIHWVGFKDDIRPYLEFSDVLVLPSYREGFPNVVLQALAMKTPVIATNINGCNEIIDDGYNGWLIPKQDKTALVNSILNASKFSRNELNLMGENGRNIVKEKFEKKKHLSRVLNFYNSKSNLSNNL